MRKKKTNQLGYIDTKELITEREKTHGDWKKQSTLAWVIKTAIHQSTNWKSERLSPPRKEALDQALIKIARICEGDPNNLDHWDDACGYLRLGRDEGHKL